MRERLATLSVSNMNGARELSHQLELEPSGSTNEYKVLGSTPGPGKAAYFITIKGDPTEEELSSQAPVTALRRCLSCTCLGYTAHHNILCKHLGAILIQAEKHRSQSMTQDEIVGVIVTTAGASAERGRLRHRAQSLGGFASRVAAKRRQGPAGGDGGLPPSAAAAPARSEASQQIAALADRIQDMALMPRPETGGTQTEERGEARGVSPGEEALFGPEPPADQDVPRRRQLRGRSPSPVSAPVFNEYDPSDAMAGVANLRNGAHLSMGHVIGFSDATQTHGAILYLLQRCALAPCRVVLMAYTFDYPEIVEAMKRVGRNSHARAELIADRRESLGRSTRDQTVSLQALLASGVTVRVADGKNIQQEYAQVGRMVPPAKGIHHRKSLFVFFKSKTQVRHLDGSKWGESYAIVGSTNFTTSSRSNQELSVIMSLNTHGTEEAEQLIDRAHRSSTLLTDQVVQESEEERSKRQSTRSSRSVSRSANPDRRPAVGWATDRDAEQSRARMRADTQY